ncbi:MAG: hypothetical protein IJS08_18095, partial [Victivallales bacterium]|nr:hypothetical protein [Victivallales bacterium]
IGHDPNADIYIIDYKDYIQATGDNWIVQRFSPEEPTEFTGQDLFLFLDTKCLMPSPYPWAMICRRSFLLANHLRFVPKLVFEDVPFFYRAIYKAKRIVPLHIVFYFYRHREGSIMTQTFNGLYYLTNRALVYQALLAFYVEVSREPDYNRKLDACWAKSWCAGIFIYWFSEAFVKKVPRAQRLETLRLLFSDGFDNFNALLKSSGFRRRLAAWWIRLFVKHPSLARASELFFLRVYFPLANRQNKLKS